MANELNKTKVPKVLIMSGYGINCEKESAYAFEKTGAKAEIVHVNDLISKKKNMANYDIMMFPGGFSYGDDTGSGNAFANKLKNNLWNELMVFVKEGKLIIGVCNGFQIMTLLGLFSLPNENYGDQTISMEQNNSNRYECRWVYIKNHSKKCIFTKGIEITHIPIGHGEGRFYCDKNTYDGLKKNDQIVFTYCNTEGKDAQGEYPLNPNGSMNDVAGICDKSGRIFGMMPHPERGLFSLCDPDYQLEKEVAKRRFEKIPDISENNFKIFRNAVEHIKNKNIG